MSGVFRSYSFKKWIYQSSSLSTNADLAQSVSKIPSNTNIVLYTYKQWAGKGQIGRKWYSGTHKNLTFSLQIEINELLAKDQFHFNMIISLVLRDFLSSIIGKFKQGEDKCTIKWPNDIYIKDQKLSGILIQNTLADKFITKSMVGIGINVNEDEFPQDLPNPISLSQITNNDFDLDLLFANMISYFERRFFDYDQMSFQELKKRYIEKMFGLHQVRTFTLSENKQIFEGEIIGITDGGMLSIKQKERLSHFNFREITYNI